MIDDALRLLKTPVPEPALSDRELAEQVLARATTMGPAPRPVTLPIIVLGTMLITTTHHVEAAVLATTIFWLSTLVTPVRLGKLLARSRNPMVQRTARRWQRQSGDGPMSALLAGTMCAAAPLPVLAITLFLTWALVQGLLRAIAARGVDHDTGSREVLELSGMPERHIALGYLTVALAPTLLELLCGGAVLTVLTPPLQGLALTGSAVLVAAVAGVAALAGAGVPAPHLALAIALPLGAAWVGASVHFASTPAGRFVGMCHAAVGVLVATLVMQWWRSRPCPEGELRLPPPLPDPFLAAVLSMDSRAWLQQTSRQLMGLLLLMVPLAWLGASMAAVLTFLVWGFQLAFRSQSAARHEAAMALLLVTRLSPARLFAGQLLTSVFPLAPIWLAYCTLMVKSGDPQGISAALLAIGLSTLGATLGLANRYGLSLRFDRSPTASAS